MSRPAVDVVVPFLGSEESLRGVGRALAALRTRRDDTLVIVDNTPGPPRRVPLPAGVAVLRAGERATPGYARNRGAAAGHAPWLVFFDADTIPAADLLERYFDPAPGERVALLGGAVRDEPVPPRGRAAARYSYIRAAMSQEDTFRPGPFGFPKTANVAVRRAAFEAVGGFREDIRAAEDADFSYRLRAAGWEIERREAAEVVHLSRQTLGAFARQKALHGAGGAWLERHYPGSFPARRRVGMLWWAVRSVTGGVLAAVLERDRDRALWAVFEPVEGLSWEFGRSLPNERPLTVRVWLRALRRLRRRRIPPSDERSRRR